MRRIISMLAAAMLLNCSLAAAQQGSPTGEAVSAARFQQSLTDMVKIPSNGVVAAIGADVPGIVFMTDNARYVVVGKVFDMWSGSQIESLDALRASLARIDFKGLNLKVEDLGPVIVGNGPKEVVLFTDPTCSNCKVLYEALKPLEGKYTFKILVVPALGRESERKMVLLACAVDQKKAKSVLLTGGDPSGLPQDPACKKETMQRRLISAHLLGVKGVPMLVAPDGRTRLGKPQDLDTWLSGQ